MCRSGGRFDAEDSAIDGPHAWALLVPGIKFGAAESTAAEFVQLLAMIVTAEQGVGQELNGFTRPGDRQLHAAFRRDDFSGALMIETDDRGAGGERFEHDGAAGIAEAAEDEEIRPAEAGDGFVVVEPAEPLAMLIDAEAAGQLTPAIFQRTTTEDL